MEALRALMKNQHELCRCACAHQVSTFRETIQNTHGILLRAHRSAR